jgi:predicted lysophospholipase L1 biosynthesis ABC-type transport system permease subunit
VRPQGDLNGWTQVVGVVENSKVSSLDEGPTPMLFYPVRQSPASGYVLVRTDGNPSALLPGLRAALQAVDPNLPLSALGTLRSRLAGSLAMPTIATRLLGAFSLLAMLLARLGLYGVVSFSVCRRSPEMGIRIAMGAERGQLIQMVMREMLLTVTVGLALGVGFALLTAPALGPVLYQVPAVDIASFVFGAVLLVGVATLATYLPARRAAGVNPVVALRAR